MSSSSERGSATSTVEVTNISPHGFWLLVRGQEFFVSFEDFPWFRNQPIAKIFNVVEPAEGHFYWPELDIDLSSEILEHPERFPLVSGASNETRQKMAV